MKKLLLVLLFMVLFSSITLAEAPFHIGLMVFTVSQTEDQERAAAQLIENYGRVEDGGMISQLSIPDNFMTEMETTISQLVSFADDPKLKAIVISQGVPGTVEGFRRVREIRPDILLFTVTPMEDPQMITDVTDLAVNSDDGTRGYLLVLAAKKMGAENFVYISFPRHLSQELIGRQKRNVEMACEEFGIKFRLLSAPDPTSDVGVAGAQQFVLEKIPSLVEEYGKNTVFFTTNGALEEPIVKRVAELGALYVEAFGASPIRGYPGALGIKFEESDKGDWPAVLKKVEDAVIAAGASGRMGTWAFSYNYGATIGLVEHAKRVVEGKSELLNKEDILAAFGKYSPGAEWMSTYYVDPDGVVRENFLLVYQDTYVFGRGFLNQTSEVIPEKYYED